MLDTKLIGGTIIDGTGRPGFTGDIGIKNGRIVSVGQVGEAARETLDVAGCTVAPGFIDAHTHYDAQVFWDPKLSPSCYHGVTTVVGGFCGFSIAPITPESAEYIKPMLARVEGMPLETLEAAVPWNWSSFGDYLAKLDGNIGLNAGFFAGHSAIRRMVMGERAVGNKATADDLEQMRRLLDESLAEGALGLSTTVSPTHNDGDGNPVPSRWADLQEFVELAQVVSKHEGTGLEMLPDLEFGPDQTELLTQFSIAGNRPVNWNVLVVFGRPDAEEIAERQLNASNVARERGGEVIALTMPSTPGIYLNLRTGVTLDALPGIWREIFKVPVGQRIEKFRDPAVRQQMRQDAASLPAGAPMEMFTNFGNYFVVSVHAEQNKQYEERKIVEIAAAEGRESLDVMLSIACDDKLETVFTPDAGGEDQATYELRGRIWADDRTLIGASDAGAHLDLIDSFAFSTCLLQKGVREHKVISLEEAVHQITQRPATYFGLVERGLIAEGFHADLVVFDPDTVGRGPTYKRYDVPGGNGGNEFRLYADAQGVDHVFVNGVQIISHGEHTGSLPGSVLRSGEDTRTVGLDALRENRTGALSAT